MFDEIEQRLAVGATLSETVERAMKLENELTQRKILRGETLPKLRLDDLPKRRLFARRLCDNPSHDMEECPEEATMRQMIIRKCKVSQLAFCVSGKII